VLSVTAQASTLNQARERAYAGVAQIAIAGSHFRSDIARNACATNS
jgi:phosphoribosylamine---glycine ligase